MAAALAKKDVRVKSIFVYPTKSCRGTSVAEAPISPTGFQWDRQWMVVDSGGRAITQRVEPKPALVQTQLPHQAFSLHWQPNNHSFLEIKAPGMEVVKVPLVRSSASSEKEKVVDGISVWEWCGSAVDEGAAAAQWFSNYLVKPTRLVRFNQASQVRSVEAEYAPGYSVMFADMYPFLLLSQGSMDALNALLKEPIPVNRFRPNILVDGCEAFGEDVWSEMRINDSTFKGVKLYAHAARYPQLIKKVEKSVEEPLTLQTRSWASDQIKPCDPTRNRRKGRCISVCSDSLAGNGKNIKVGDSVVVLKMLSSLANAPA